jgi:peptide deformylase
MTRKLMFYSLLFLSILTFSQCKKEVIPPDPPVDELAFTDAEKAIVFNNSRDSALRVLNYFIYNDSLILRKQSRNVNFNDTATLFYLTDRMFLSVTTEGGVGIAAPQVGINRNIIWVWRNDKPSHPWELYFNPVITHYSDTLKQRNDGCLSIPGVSGQSWRAIWVDVEYDLPDGTHKAEHISQAYTAHIFQHEIDHLNGIVWLDRINQ